MKFSLRPKLSNKDPILRDQLIVNYQSIKEQSYLPLINENLDPNENLYYYNDNGKQSKINLNLLHAKQSEISKDQIKQILEPKPHNLLNYCEICDNIYGDYLRHINSNEHQYMFEKHFYNPELLGFIDNFKKNQKKRKHTDQSEIEQQFRKKFIHPFDDVDHKNIGEITNSKIYNLKNLINNMTLSDKKTNNFGSLYIIESVKISVKKSKKRNSFIYQISQTNQISSQQFDNQIKSQQNIKQFEPNQQDSQNIQNNQNSHTQQLNILMNQLQSSLDDFQINIKKEFQSRIIKKN